MANKPAANGKKYDRDEMDPPRDAPTVAWLVPMPDTRTREREAN